MAGLGKYIFAAVVSGFAWGGVACAADVLSIDYDVSLGGSRIMKASYSATLNDETYSASLSAKTVGVSKMFSKIKLNLSAQGRVTNKGFLPASYNYFRKKNDKTKERALQFSADGSLKTDGAGYEDAIVAAAKKSAIDPLSMLLIISRSSKPCSGKHRAFDGRDVFDISLSSVGTTAGKLTCKLVYTPVAGGDVNDGETQPQIYEITLASTKTAQNYITIGIKGTTKGVPFSVDATSASLNGAAMSF
jgi:hypothetical protein